MTVGAVASDRAGQRHAEGEQDEVLAVPGDEGVDAEVLVAPQDLARHAAGKWRKNVKSQQHGLTKRLTWPLIHSAEPT